MRSILCAVALATCVGPVLASDPTASRHTAPVPAAEAAPAANPTPQAVVVSEGFDDVAALQAAGWTLANLSAPVGTIPNWYQGNVDVFTAYDGAANAYVAANYNFSGSPGTINGWLVTPAVSFGRDASLSFHTRKTDPDDYPDRLEVRLCTTMPCTNLGSGPGDVGDFTELLLSINPSLVTGVYPTSWTQFQAGVAQGLPRSGQGRIAFRYYVTDSGPSGSNSDYIGIDRVVLDDGGAPAYFVGGTVSGLAGGTLELAVTGGETLALSADGAFSFSTLFDESAPYAVTVVQQPGTPPQVCTVSGGSGTIAGADVDNVAVQCQVLRDVSGSVAGLAGSGLVLQLNGGNDQAIAANGGYGFADLLVDGDAYAVTVAAQPSAPNQDCQVANGSGTVAGDVTGVDVTCTTLQYSVGGSASGLAGSGLVLQLNGGNDLSVAADGAFQFPGLDDGSAYVVTVAAQPTAPVQTCSVANGSGVLAGSAVSDVVVTCVTEQFPVGGTVAGLQGSGLVLQLNGGNDLPVAADGAFQFPALDDGSAYLVTVAVQPTGPVQTCSVANGSGVLAGSAVSDVVVTCATDEYQVGGTVAGLQGSGLLLQLNGGNDLSIAADGAFTFAAPLADGSSYAVTVAAQPSAPVQACTVANGSGVLAGADVAGVAVTCTTTLFPVGGTISGLTTAGLQLRLNGSQDLVLDANGAFSFTPGLPQGAAYLVEIVAQPAGLIECAVTNGSGTVGVTPVTGITVSCGAAVVPIASPAVIPAADRWAQLLLGMLVLLAGGLMVRRQG